MAYATLTDATGFTKGRRTVYNVVGLPLYWFLLWGADVRAFVQLAFDHLQWEKTAHFGRHIEPGEADSFESALARDGMVVAVTETPDGWTWELLESGTPVISAGSTYRTEAEAGAAFDEVLEVLPVATDSGATFAIFEETQGWTWFFEGESEPVVSPDHFEDEGRTRAQVGTTKVAAGVAVIRTPAVESTTEQGTAESIAVEPRRDRTSVESVLGLERVPVTGDGGVPVQGVEDDEHADRHQPGLDGPRQEDGPAEHVE